MYPRPAGMSDDDEDDDDDIEGFSLYKKEDSPCSKKEDSTERKLASCENTNNCDEEYISEDHIIKACMTGSLNVIQEYLEQHDIDKFLSTGWTLLLYAASAAQAEIIEYLLAHDANPNKHKDGFTPLMALCNSTNKIIEKSLKCLMLLIEAKADVDIRNKERETALMYACKIQDTKFVLELIKYVNDIDACDNDGKTALSYAVIFNKPDLVKLLLEYNADASTTDRYNLTPKDIADTKGFTEISALLSNNEEEVVITTCEISQMTSWKDLFPNLYPKNKELLDHDISTILYGMGLEKYGILFQGMGLKTFLQLTEDDLCRLGIDITVHRKQFLENLQKFHSKKWNVDSVGVIKKSLPYTIYDGVISLGIIKKQIGVIASSFQYIKNNLIKAASEDIHLDPVQRIEYEEELRKTQKTLRVLKNEIMHLKNLAWKIDKENNIGIPADFITKPKKSKKFDRIIILSATLMIGLYLSKTHIQRLWNTYTIRM